MCENNGVYTAWMAMSSQQRNQLLNLLNTEDDEYRAFGEALTRLVPNTTTSDAQPTFTEKLAELINRYSLENNSNTPDFLLAEYMIRSLSTFSSIIRKRDTWHGVHLEPGNKHFTADDDVGNNSQPTSFLVDTQLETDHVGGLGAKWFRVTAENLNDHTKRPEWFTSLSNANASSGGVNPVSHIFNRDYTAVIGLRITTCNGIDEAKVGDFVVKDATGGLLIVHMNSEKEVRIIPTPDTPKVPKV